MGEKNEQDVSVNHDDQTEQVKRLAYLVGKGIGQAVNRWKQIWPDRILVSGNRTIVFWADGTKTVVKRADEENDSIYAAYTAALAIKMYGSNSKLKKIIADRTEVQMPKK